MPDAYDGGYVGAMRVSGTVRRTRLTSRERREQLLTIGVRMLTDRRLEDLSIDDIADQAGISRGLLFHYFDSMHEYQISVTGRVMAELVDRLAQPAAGHGPPGQRLRDSLSVYIDYIAERPAMYRSVVRGAASGHERMRELADQTREQIVDLLLSSLRSSDSEHAVLNEPAARIGAHAWISMTEELVTRWLEDPVIDREAVIGRIVAPLPSLLGIDTIDGLD